MTVALQSLLRIGACCVDEDNIRTIPVSKPHRQASQARVNQRVLHPVKRVEVSLEQDPDPDVLQVVSDLSCCKIHRSARVLCLYVRMTLQQEEEHDGHPAGESNQCIITFSPRTGMETL